MSRCQAGKCHKEATVSVKWKADSAGQPPTKLCDEHRQEVWLPPHLTEVAELSVRPGADLDSVDNMPSCFVATKLDGQGDS